MRPQKFEAVDAIRARHLMIVAELREDDGLASTPIAHLSWWRYQEPLDGLDPVCIFMDVPISSNHGVMGGIRKLYTGNQESDGVVSVAIEDRGGVRGEPGSPGII
jgi:hypothetical protein